MLHHPFGNCINSFGIMTFLFVADTRLHMGDRPSLRCPTRFAMFQNLISGIKQLALLASEGVLMVVGFYSDHTVCVQYSQKGSPPYSVKSSESMWTGHCQKMVFGRLLSERTTMYNIFFINAFSFVR